MITTLDFDLPLMLCALVYNSLVTTLDRLLRPEAYCDHNNSTEKGNNMETRIVRAGKLEPGQRVRFPGDVVLTVLSCEDLPKDKRYVTLRLQYPESDGRLNGYIAESEVHKISEYELVL